jgi:hypothetical protein
MEAKVDRAAAHRSSPPPSGGGAPAGGRWLRWCIGWLGLPALVATVVFVTGMHMGAARPDLWITRLVLWIVERFSS